METQPNRRAILRQLGGAAALAATAGCTAPRPSGLTDGSAAASQALQQLQREADEAMLRRHPAYAWFRGDFSRLDRFGPSPGPESNAEEREIAQRELQRALTIDAAALGPLDRLALDSFVHERRIRLRSTESAVARLDWLQPYVHMNAFVDWVATLASGESVVPYRDVGDHEAGLRRLKAAADQLDRMTELARQGIAAGVVRPQHEARQLAKQHRDALAMLADPLGAKSPFAKPLRADAATTIPAAERARLQAALDDALRRTWRPAVERAEIFLRERYLPAARETAGYWALPGGEAAYALAVEEHTTLPLDPRAVHATGLAECRRIEAAMGPLFDQLGIRGATLAARQAALRDDPRNRFGGPDDALARYRAIARRVEAGLPRLFHRVPKTPVEVRPMPEHEASGQAFAYYMPGEPKASRPGIFYFDGTQLATATLHGAETLYAHEAMPGHHLQIMLATENEALPPSLRHGGTTAFTEGWALYAESLGSDLGLYQEPLQRLGNLDDEMLRAVRLVVDTGMHAMRWTTQQALDFAAARVGLSMHDLTTEIHRYTAWPGQALAYKTGQMTIAALREEARAALGPRFDLRDFHDQVLGTGSLPLPVLQRKLRAWIQAGGGRA